jgi:hypothetical protein
MYSHNLALTIFSNIILKLEPTKRSQFKNTVNSSIVNQKINNHIKL